MLNVSYRTISTLVALMVMLTYTAWGQSEKIIHTFSGGNDGAVPLAGLISDSNGNFYGTTESGGINGAGTVFQLTPNSSGTWSETILYTFNFDGSGDAAFPTSSLIFDAQGNLYGTALAGGSVGQGAIFELSPQANKVWTEKILYSFAGGTDGGFLYGEGLTLDSKGNLYGTSDLGGVHGFGAIFELVAGANGTWTKKILHNFTGGNDGAASQGQQLSFDAAGNLYGMAGAGPNDYGLVFELMHQSNGSWTEKTVHAFTGGADGASGPSTLIIDAAGNIYAASTFSVFQLIPGTNGTWTKKDLHVFSGGVDGASPESRLVFDKAGNLYGTTRSGGVHRGTVFELSPNADGSWSEKILHKFGQTAADGSFPFFAGLAVGIDGNLYGTTESGGTSGAGVVFSIKP